MAYLLGIAGAVKCALLSCILVNVVCLVYNFGFGSSL